MKPSARIKIANAYNRFPSLLFLVSAGVSYHAFCFVEFVPFGITNASLRERRIENILSVSAIFYAVINQQLNHNFLPIFASIRNVSPAVRKEPYF